MKVSYRWLKALAPTIPGSAQTLAERLTYTAVPVDEVSWLGAGLGELVVGRVAKITQHPKADRLVICQVDAGRSQPVQVVTGAPVVVEGGFYPFVGVGQTLPGGQQIKSVKLRGETSQGMLCSERELGVGRDASGIMQLHGEFEPGQPLLEALELDDYRFEVDVTANRPDLLGHWGVARELAPGGEADLELPEFPGQRSFGAALTRAVREGSTAGVTVRIEDPEGCPRYMGAIIRGVKVGPSPAWLANRLRALALQPINNVVDATNYVLYELNQPLHAFDLAALRGPAVVIRRARPGELLRTLDGKNRTLDSDILAIADAEVATALAGVMGGEESEVSEKTRDVFIECAYFDPKRVRQGARRLGLDTDASYRFQRGIDPEGTPRAMNRVVELILTIAGGKPDGDIVDVYPTPVVTRTARLRPQRVESLLGVELSRETIRACIEPIGFRLEDDGADAFTVQVPTWRPDVEREVDLIEEVARRHGYDKFPDEMRAFRPTTVPEDDYVDTFNRLRELMVGLGFLEARSSPFVPPSEGEVRLLNPLSEREDHLRRDLLSGLLHRLEYNFGRGQRDIRLFELGTVFGLSDGPLPDERIRMTAVWTGSRHPPHWSGGDGDWDLWDLEWALSQVAGLAVPGAEVRPLDPGAESGRDELERSLVVVSPEGRELGRGGRISAGRVDAPRWAGAVWGFELEVEPGQRTPVVYQALPSFPAVERDIALLLPKRLLSAEVGAVIREAAPAFLETLSVFDVYEGENIPNDRRSVAWRLRFRAVDRTLTDDEVDEAMGRITAALEEKLDVAIRGT